MHYLSYVVMQLCNLGMCIAFINHVPVQLVLWPSYTSLGNICCCNIVEVTLRNMLLNVASNFLATVVANHL